MTVNVAGPAVVGVPEITPVAASRLNPAGSAPEVTTNGATLTAGTVNEYATPTVAAGTGHGQAYDTAITDTVFEPLLVT